MDTQTLLNTLVNDILKEIGVAPSVVIENPEENMYLVKIDGDDLNFLIGYRGKSLEALQFLLGQIIFRKTNVWTNVLVDINQYRTQKQEKIESITKNYIDKVRFLNKDVSMPPMTSLERRYVHEFLKEYSDVVSESEGTGLNRHVILRPKH